MGKNYLKRLTIPNTWSGILKKENVYIVRPSPGPHSVRLSMPVSILLRQLKYGHSGREIKFILNNKEVLVNQRKILDPKFPVGFLDVFTIQDLKEDYRMLLNDQGKLTLSKITKHADRKISKIIDKRTVAKGKTQINLSDGRNFLLDNHADYHPGDSIVLEVPTHKVLAHLPLKEHAHMILTGGKHIGETGTVLGLEGKQLTYKNNEGKEIKTLKKYAYVVGENVL